MMESTLKNPKDKVSQKKVEVKAEVKGRGQSLEVGGKISK